MEKRIMQLEARHRPQVKSYAERLEAALQSIKAGIKPNWEPTDCSMISDPVKRRFCERLNAAMKRIEKHDQEELGTV